MRGALSRRLAAVCNAIEPSKTIDPVDTGTFDPCGPKLSNRFVALSPIERKPPSIRRSAETSPLP